MAETMYFDVLVEATHKMRPGFWKKELGSPDTWENNARSTCVAHQCVETKYRADQQDTTMQQVYPTNYQHVRCIPTEEVRAYSWDGDCDSNDSTGRVAAKAVMQVEHNHPAEAMRVFLATIAWLPFIVSSNHGTVLSILTYVQDIIGES